MIKNCNDVSDKQKSTEISVIVPVFNEEKNIELLIPMLSNELRKLGRSYEIVAVNDGSLDDTRCILCEILKTTPNLRVVTLARRSGQVNAISAGLSVAVGENIITFDGDLQLDVKDIKKLFDNKDEFCFFCGGKRVYRDDPYLVRILPSKIFNLVFSLIVGYRVYDFGCALKMYPRWVIDMMFDKKGICHFSRGLPFRLIKNIKEYPISCHARRYGKSKWGWWALFACAPKNILDSLNFVPRLFFWVILIILNPIVFLTYTAIILFFNFSSVKSIIFSIFILFLFSFSLLPFWCHFIKRKFNKSYIIKKIQRSKIKKPIAVIQNTLS